MSYFTDPAWEKFDGVRRTNNQLFSHGDDFWRRFLPNFAREEFKRARKRKKYLLFPRHITFPCSTYDVHTITIWPSLKMTWHNHNVKDIKKKVMAFLLIKGKNSEEKMTKYLCGCEQVYLKLTHPELVNRHDLSCLDGTSQIWMDNMSSVSTHRKEFNDKIKKETFKSLRELIKAELSRNLTPLLNGSLHYRTPAYRYSKTEYNFVITPDRDPSIEVETKTEVRKQSWRRSKNYYNWVLNCFLPPSWYMSIYKKNLWNFNGNLVLDIKKRYPHEMALALLGKQSNGSVIKSCWAILNYEFKTIRWIEETEAQEFLQTNRVPRRMTPRTKEEPKPNADVFSTQETIKF